MLSTCFKRQYSKPTLVSDWHKHREAEPKDYDLTLCPDGKKNLCNSTYKHLGTSLDADWATTTQIQQGQCLLKKDQSPDDRPTEVTDIIQSADFDRSLISREMGQMTNVGLPCHKSGHNHIQWDTTYGVDYLSRCGYRTEPRTRRIQPVREPDFRKRLSQFTDTAGHRRAGRNTFQDESGVYVTLGDRTSINNITNPICP